MLAPVIRKITGDFFLEDFKFIRFLGASSGLREAASDVKRSSNTIIIYITAGQRRIGIRLTLGKISIWGVYMPAQQLLTMGGQGFWGLSPCT